jgi:hypothetical protein
VTISKAKIEEWRALAEKAARLGTPDGRLPPTFMAHVDPRREPLEAALDLAREALPALLDEVERLERRLGAMEASHAAVLRLSEDAARTANAALSLLREVEWSGVGTEDVEDDKGRWRTVVAADDWCVANCGVRKRDGKHAPDCRLNALLR